VKKCLHLKKTKPHWRRKPLKVVTRKDRLEAEKAERQRRLTIGQAMGMGGHISIVTAALLSGQRSR